MNTINTYAIKSAGTSGQVWTSDGSGAGKWANSSGVTVSSITTRAKLYSALDGMSVGDVIVAENIVNYTTSSAYNTFAPVFFMKIASGVLVAGGHFGNYDSGNYGGPLVSGSYNSSSLTIGYANTNSTNKEISTKSISFSGSYTFRCTNCKCISFSGFSL